MAIIDTNVFFADVILLAECLDATREAAAEAKKAAEEAAAAATAAAKAAANGHVLTTSGAMLLITAAATAVAAEAAAAEAAEMKGIYSNMQEQLKKQIASASTMAAAAIKTHYEKEESYW
jgi:hypothetical protein